MVAIASISRHRRCSSHRRRHTSDNELTVAPANDGSGDVYHYTYDHQGNRTQTILLNSSGGTLSTTNYTWDYRNRLTEVETFNGSGTETSDVQYAYNAFDQRIAQKIDSNGDGTFDSEESYYYDGTGTGNINVPGAANIAMGSGNLILTLSGPGGDAVLRRYLMGDQPNQVFAEETVGGTNTTRWALADQNGSVRDVVDNSGNLIDHIIYDVYGNVTYQSDSTQAIKPLFEGMVYDFYSGLYYDNHRYYDATQHVFISVDPMSYAAGQTNLYEIGGNDLMDHTDTTGLWYIDGDYAVTEGSKDHSDNLGTLAQILFGTSGPKSVAKLGFNKPATSLKVGDRIDISQWIKPNVDALSQYDTTLQALYSLCESDAAVLGTGDPDFLEHSKFYEETLGTAVSSMGSVQNPEGLSAFFEALEFTHVSMSIAELAFSAGLAFGKNTTLIAGATPLYNGLIDAERAEEGGRLIRSANVARDVKVFKFGGALLAIGSGAAEMISGSNMKEEGQEDLGNATIANGAIGALSVFGGPPGIILSLACTAYSQNEEKEIEQMNLQTIAQWREVSHNAFEIYKSQVAARREPYDSAATFFGKFNAPPELKDQKIERP